MPRKAVISIDIILSKLKEGPQIFDELGKLKKKSNVIWPHFTKKLDNDITVAHLWQILHENRHKAQDSMRLHYDMPIPETKPKWNENEEDEDGNQSANDQLPENQREEIIIQPKRSFNIILTSSDWKRLKPTPVKQFRNDRSSKVRIVLHFKEGWGAVLHDILWEQHRLPCAYSLRAQINSDPTLASCYATIAAECNECKGTARGQILNEPEDDLPVSIVWHATDSREVVHSSKRKLEGSRRAQVALDASCPNEYRRKLAGSTMDLNGNEPPNLPNAATIRKAKQEQRDKALNLPSGSNEFETLVTMKRSASSRHLGSIHDIMVDKVTVTYDTPEQMLVYKSKLQAGYTRLTGDATGSLVERIPRLVPSLGLSAHIFLYELVLSGDIQIPVTQFLSEKQDTCTIVSWLSDWLKRGGKPPNEIVCDASAALLSAFAKVFCKCESLKTYIEKQYLFITGELEKPVPCYLRKDVAHMTSNLANWKPWQEEGHNRVRDFYIRCFALLVQCTNFQDFCTVLSQVLVVAKSETIGHTNEGEAVPAERSLEALSAAIGNIENFDNEFLKENPEAHHLQDVGMDHLEETPSSVSEWMQSLKVKAEEDCCGNGDRLSPYCSQGIAAKFEEYGLDFMLWSAVLVPAYNSPFLRPSSAASESDFNDLKNRILKHHKKPMKLSKMVAMHLDSINGQTKLASARQKEQVATVQNTSIIANHEEKSAEDDEEDLTDRSHAQTNENQSDAAEVELNLEENWRNLANKGRKTRSASKFFQPSSESRLAQESARLRPPQKRLLRNGSLCGFISETDSQIQLKNTCNIDSLCHALAVGYIEFKSARDFIDSSSDNNLLFGVVKILATEGALRDAYAARIKVAQDITQPDQVVQFKSPGTRSQKEREVLMYDCIGNVCEQVSMLLQSAPAITTTIQCATNRRHKRVLYDAVIIPNDDSLMSQGLENLSVVINSSIIYENTPCFVKKCEGANEKNQTLSAAFFVDVSIISQMKNSYRGKLKHNYELQEFPISIEVLGKTCHLTGVVTLQPGHTIAFARRLGGLWEKYDNVRNGVMSAVPHQSVRPLLLLYIVV